MPCEILARDAKVHCNVNALMTEVICDCEAFDSSAVRQTVSHKVHAPDLPPTSRTNVKFVKSVTMENDGHSKSRFTDEQIIGFLRQAEAGMPIKELCRSGGFSDATFYKWRAKYGGMQASDAGKLRQLESENAKLKKLLAEAHLDIHALKGVFGVKR